MNMLYTISLIYLFSFGYDKIENISISESKALSIDLNGNIYLADTNNNRIVKFDHEGEFIKTIGGFGWEKEEFDSPIDICAKSSLDILVADHNNHRIERYDKDMNYISSYYSDESLDASLQFAYPAGVAISIHGEIILIDSENKRLLKINSFGQPEMSFGAFSEGKGKLNDPLQIDIGANDRIFVSDESSAAVLVFDYFGNYLTHIGEGLLSRPRGIFIDEQDRLWIADKEQKSIFVFSTSGELILQFSGNQNSVVTIDDPVDIVTYKNRVYVLNDNKIQVFELINNSTE